MDRAFTRSPESAWSNYPGLRAEKRATRLQEELEEGPVDDDDDLPIDQLMNNLSERESRQLDDEQEQLRRRPLDRLRDLMIRIRGCGFDQCVNEIDDYGKEVRRQFGDDVYRTLKRMHENLGHPTRQRLSMHLRHAGHDEVLSCGRCWMQTLHTMNIAPMERTSS